MAVGERIHMAMTTLKRILFEREIVAKQFAEEVGISKGSMSQIVNGRTPTLEVAYRIARKLGMAVEEVWPYEEVVKEDEE